ncbi:MAG: YkgJ family cysteine cluster protein [Bacteriovoracaceae bacterium]|nr:YkgJ family cysteine cluster protein [Bacteriovoracaceae bacterium]
MPVEVDMDDLILMNVLTEFDKGEDIKKIHKKLKKSGIVQHFNIKEEIFTLSQMANRECLYLDQTTRRCSIYEKRPKTCRKHPQVSSRPNYCAYQKK